MSSRRRGRKAQKQEVDNRERDATMASTVRRSNRQRGKKAQTQEVDATMAPAPTVKKSVFHYLSDDDEEDHPLTKKLRTSGSFQINDCNLMDRRDLVHEAILENVRNEEPIITNEERIEDHHLQLTINSGGQMTTSTKREEFFSKRLTKNDVNRSFGDGLKLPLKLVIYKIFNHISAPADGDEGKPLTLVDHEGGKWDMLFVLKSKKYYLTGEWYNYVEKYELKDSDTIIIEKITISKEQVKEVVDFAAVNQIGNHDWDIFSKDEQIETKDIDKDEVAYEITIERGSGNTATEQEDDDSSDEE